MRFMDQGWQKTGLPFMKMHGLGNDFVVVDARGRSNPVNATLAIAVGDRHRGVGFDQLAVILDSDDADAALQFWNADGSLSAACGNATRCIAAHLMAQSGADRLILKTERGLLLCLKTKDGTVSVNMGLPQLSWREIPLAKDVDTLHLPIDGDPVALGIGNPHCVFIVDDAEATDLPARGSDHETHPLYPQRTNVEFAQVLSENKLRLRIWERGVGATLASGSCSCAAVVATARRGLTGRSCQVHVDGGVLDIDWRDDGVWMSGPTAHVFDGVFTADFLKSLV